MKIYPRNNNPVVKNQQDMDELIGKVNEIDPLLDEIHLFSDKVKIRRIGIRTFKYPKSPTIDWVVGRVKIMNDRNL